MRNLKTRAIAVISLLALLAVSGVALAASEDDTVINHGYDEDSQFFMWNVTKLDYEPWIEATESDDALLADDIGDLLETCGLDPDGEGTEFDYTAAHNADGTFEITISDESGEIDTVECGEFVGAFVTGPNGQVNHGMFLKTFNEIYEGPNRGCIVRHLAQSDLGKGDQQVRAGDGTAAGPTESSEIVEGTATFETAVAACLKGPGDDDSENEAEGETEAAGRRGPPDHVLDKFGGQHPRDAKGKSGGAPGKNKP